MAEIIGLHHPGLYVPKEKMEETIRFYVDVMGYELYYRGTYFDTNYVLLKLHDGTWLEIEDISDIYPPLEKDDHGIFEDVSYVVDDLAEFIKMAQDKGAKVTLPIEEAVFAEEKKVYVARIKTPLGEELAFMQLPAFCQQAQKPVQVYPPRVHLPESLEDLSEKSCMEGVSSQVSSLRT